MSPVDTAPVTPNPMWARDFASDLKSAPETLSSWDNCMAKSYCKWPVVVAIIVASLIVLSIVACVINCLCCGIQCCKCCGCCSCCCPSPRNKDRKAKYLDDPYNQPQPYNQPYNQQYTQPPPMQPSPAPPAYRGAQTARFDSPSSPGTSKNDDALPAMPSWDNAVTRRVEDSDPHSDAVEMEPLNPANQGPRRSPAPQPVGGGYNRAVDVGYMGPPPARVPTASSYYPESRVNDDQSLYAARRSPGVGSPPPMSPYDNQPYRDDYSPGNPWNSASPAPTYTTQPQYMPMASAMSPSAEIPRPVPYRQPSPGLMHSAEPPRAMPYRQPSPGLMHSAEPPRAIPYRQPSPGLMHSADAPRPIPYRQPSPGFAQSPITPSPITQTPVYRAFSPSVPSSPPPPFTATAAPNEVSDSGRPPSLLQSGRKPVPNSYRDV